MKPYGVLQLVESSPVSFDEPFKIEDIKTHAKVQNDAEDFLIAQYIHGARKYAEIEQNRDLVPKLWDLYLDSFCATEIQLRIPLNSVESIQYTDSDGNTVGLTEGVEFRVDTARGLVMPMTGQSWPSFTAQSSSAVRIRFNSGYSSTHPFWSHDGALLKMGMLYLITGWIWRRVPFVAPGEPLGGELPFSVACLRFGANPRVW